MILSPSRLSLEAFFLWNAKTLAPTSTVSTSRRARAQHHKLHDLEQRGFYRKGQQVKSPLPQSNHGKTDHRTSFVPLSSAVDPCVWGVLRSRHKENVEELVDGVGIVHARGKQRFKNKHGPPRISRTSMGPRSLSRRTSMGPRTLFRRASMGPRTLF